MITLQCTSCGKDFSVKAYRHKQRFCSHACSAKREHPAWHAEAKRLKAEGMIHEHIAKRLGVSSGSVGWAVTESTRAKATLRRQEQSRKDAKERRCIIHRWTGPGGNESANCFFKAHQYRTPAEIIDRDAVMPAARLFAAGKISVAELMARITPR